MAVAEHKLRNLLEKILDERDYVPRKTSIQAITSGGANVTSALFLVDVTSPGKDELHLFAKVANIGKEMRKKMNAEWLFETERYFYSELVKRYEEIQDENGIFDEYRFVFPKYYGHNHEVYCETVVLENLVKDGYKSFDRFKSMDWNHASTCVETLAKFHALSFAFEKNYPEEFYNMLPDRKHRLGNDEPDEADIDVYQKMVKSALSVIKEEQRESVMKIITDGTMLKKLYAPIGKAVLCHGDYRLSNILFKEQGDKLKAMAVDYQTLHSGCPVGDLIYFIFLGSDEEFRSQYYEKLLDHYYRSLEEALIRLSLDPADVYPRGKFDSDFKELLPCSLVVGAVILPVITVEAANSPRVDGDAGLNEFVIEPNELFASRFNGIVNDCVRFGAINISSSSYGPSSI